MGIYLGNTSCISTLTPRGNFNLSFHNNAFSFLMMQNLIELYSYLDDIFCVHKLITEKETLVARLAVITLGLHFRLGNTYLPIFAMQNKVTKSE